MGDKTKPKKGKKKVVIIVLVVLVVVAAIIGSSVKKMTSQVATAVNTVEVEPVQKRDLSDTISLKGTVSGITKNNATSKALAEITAVNVQVGDIVKEGDVLCTLDSSTIQDQIADLEKNMSDTNATDSINSQQTAETVSRAKEDQQTQLAAAQKAIDDAKDAYNAQSIMWDKSEDKSDAEFQSLLAAQKAVTTAEEDYQKVLETTNRTIEDAQRAVELDKYKGSDSSSKDKLTDLKEQLEEVLGTLTEREQKVLTLRFGLEDGRARTLEEVGREFNVTRERIRQIEAKALRKLRHPSRSRKLKDYLE